MSSSQGTSVCIDAGSQFCPCVLADLGECIACSLLKGESLCNCSWSGVCVYSEYLWAGKRSLPPRSEYRLEVVDVRRESKSLIVFTLGIPESLSRDLSDPGSFLFLRPPDTRQCFGAPISVMDAWDRGAKFAVQVMGPKTKALEGVSDALIARGPYWNGVFGVNRLRRLRNSMALIVARGVGQGPGLHVARRLLAAGNSVTVAALPGGSVDGVFIAGDLERLGIPLVYVSRDSAPTDALGTLLQRGFDLVHSSGPDSQHRWVASMIRASGRDVVLTVSNNSIMCCGDGVCG
ncbi:MAG: hypothetical protein NUV93_06145, partial [Firmicutes bacterium]|nr:hypothetical protein [Bacillota bacterium]